MHLLFVLSCFSFGVFCYCGWLCFGMLFLIVFSVIFITCEVICWVVLIQWVIVYVCVRLVVFWDLLVVPYADCVDIASLCVS